MPSSWNVETALEETVEAIAAGSPLPFTAAEIAEYKNRYRPDFTDQYNHGADWNAARRKVLLLSKLVGALATMLTEAKAFAFGGDRPNAVDPMSALQAAYLVSRMKICPIITGPDQFGKYCQHFPLEGIAGSAEDQATMAGHLFEVFRLLGVLA
jgi:hypothetical protein